MLQAPSAREAFLAIATRKGGRHTPRLTRMVCQVGVYNELPATSVQTSQHWAIPTVPHSLLNFLLCKRLRSAGLQVIHGSIPRRVHHQEGWQAFHVREASHRLECWWKHSEALPRFETYSVPVFHGISMLLVTSLIACFIVYLALVFIFGLALI